jgi:hypothetical protein
MFLENPEQFFYDLSKILWRAWRSAQTKAATPCGVKIGQQRQPERVADKKRNSS